MRRGQPAEADGQAEEVVEVVVVEDGPRVALQVAQEGGHGPRGGGLAHAPGDADHQGRLPAQDVAGPGRRAARVSLTRTKVTPAGAPWRAGRLREALAEHAGGPPPAGVGDEIVPVRPLGAHGDEHLPPAHVARIVGEALERPLLRRAPEARPLRGGAGEEVLQQDHAPPLALRLRRPRRPRRPPGQPGRPGRDAGERPSLSSSSVCRRRSAATGRAPCSPRSRGCRRCCHRRAHSRL